MAGPQRVGENGKVLTASRWESGADHVHGHHVFHCKGLDVHIGWNGNSWEDFDLTILMVQLYNCFIKNK